MLYILWGDFIAVVMAHKEKKVCVQLEKDVELVYRPKEHCSKMS